MLFLDRNPFIYGVCFMIFISFLRVFINSHEYANGMIYISDHTKNDLCLSFNFVQSLVFYDK